MKVYKITDASMKTRGGFQWELGVARKVKPYTGKECSEGSLHSYSDPLLAVFMNPTHGSYNASNIRMFAANTGERYNHGHLKIVSEKLTLVKEIKVPELSPLQRIEAGIRMAKLVCDDEKWNKWADGWLSGEDRSSDAAYSAAYSAADAADAAYSAAYSAAADAADAACYAACYAAYSADYYAAYYAAAYSAAHAADAAALVGREFTRRSVEILHNLKEK